MTLDPQKIKTIGVFVEKELMGEGLLKLPFLKALRYEFPQAHITWIVGVEKSVYSSYLKPLTFGLIDNIIENLFSNNMSWKYLFFKNDLPKISFDMIINTENNLKKTLILKKIPHKYFICSLHGFLYSTIKNNNISYKKSPHLTTKLIDLVDIIVQERKERDSFVIITPKKFLETVSIFFPASKKYIGLAPGAGDIRKCWSLDNFMDIASIYRQKGYIPVWILGPKETSVYQDLRKTFPEDLFPLQENELFLESPFYTIAIAKHLKVALSNDSGTGHLLGAANIPIISLFGHTRAEKVHPFSPLVHCIKSQDLGSTNINHIPKDLVAKKLDQILSHL